MNRRIKGIVTGLIALSGTSALFMNFSPVPASQVSVPATGGEFPLNQGMLRALSLPNGLVMGSSGKLFVSDYASKRLLSFSASNHVVNQVVLSDYPSGLAESSGMVYLNASRLKEIRKYDESLNLIASYPIPDRTYVPGMAVVNSSIYAIGVTSALSGKAAVYQMDTAAANLTWTTLFEFSTSRPSALAMNSKGRFFISDLGTGALKTSTVREFDDKGNVIQELKIPTSVASNIPGGVPVNFFGGASSLLVDANDNVLVGDAFGRVLSFSASGGYLGQIFPQLPLSSQLMRASALALDANNNVMVADLASVKVFSRSGDFISEYGSAGIGPNRFSGPTNVDINPAGPAKDNIFVVDAFNGAVKGFSSNGTPLFQIQNDIGYSNGGKSILLQSLAPKKVTVGSDGSLYVHWSGNYTSVDGKSAFSGLILKYDLSGKGAATMFGITSSDGAFDQGRGGNLFFLNPTDSRVDMYTMSAGSTQGAAPAARIALTNKSGNPVQFPASAAYGRGLSRDDRGNFYVSYYDSTVTPAVSRILKFNPQGVQLASMSIEQGFASTGGATVNSTGVIYVICEANKICSFNSDGSVRSSFGSAGIGIGQTNNISAIAIDSSDNLFVTDGNNHVTKFSADGEPLVH